MFILLAREDRDAKSKRQAKRSRQPWVAPAQARVDLRNLHISASAEESKNKNKGDV